MSHSFGREEIDWTTRQVGRTCRLVVAYRVQWFECKTGYFFLGYEPTSKA